MAKTTIYEMSRKNLADMTTNELKNYIRSASKKVAKDRGSRYHAVSQSAEYIAKSIGMRSMRDRETGKIRRELKLGFKGMKKRDLLQRARMLQGHFKIDVYSRDAKRYAEEVTEQTLESFERNTGISLTADEFAAYKSMISGIKDIVEKFGSDNIAKMYEEMNRKQGAIGGLKLGTILREVYSEAPEGLSQRDLIDMVSDYLAYLYDEDI